MGLFWEKVVCMTVVCVLHSIDPHSLSHFTSSYPSTSNRCESGADRFLLDSKFIGWNLFAQLKAVMSHEKLSMI